MKLVSYSTHFMSNRLLVFFKRYWRLRRPSLNPESIFVPNMFCVILCKFPSEFLCWCNCLHILLSLAEFAAHVFWRISCVHVWSCKCGRGLVTCRGYVEVDVALACMELVQGSLSPWFWYLHGPACPHAPGRFPMPQGPLCTDPACHNPAPVAMILASPYPVQINALPRSYRGTRNAIKSVHFHVIFLK